MKIFVIWLILVIAWNFGYPEASPIEDVLVAIILALFNIFLKNLIYNICERPVLGNTKHYNIFCPRSQSHAYKIRYN